MKSRHISKKTQTITNTLSHQKIGIQENENHKKTNWKDYLKEARRCLKPTGQIVIWNPLDQSINKEISNVLKDIGFQEIKNELKEITPYNYTGI